LTNLENGNFPEISFHKKMTKSRNLNNYQLKLLCVSISIKISKVDPRYSEKVTAKTKGGVQHVLCK